MSLLMKVRPVQPQLRGGLSQGVIDQRTLIVYNVPSYYSARSGCVYGGCTIVLFITLSHL